MKKLFYCYAALALAGASMAGTADDKAGKEVAQQAAAEPFPIQFSLNGSYETEYVFRGVNLLPDQTLHLFDTNVQVINSIPGFEAFLTGAGTTTRKFVESLQLPKSIKVARASGIGSFDSEVSGYGFTAGGFYAMQTDPRVEPSFFGRQSFFTEYREIDGFLQYSRSIGPVQVNLGGTYYHVEKNSDFDTAELNFGVAYTPAQFKYLTASFGYDYAGSLHNPNGYFDGHHLELKLTGDVPMPEALKSRIRLDPYILVSAGSGIIPRSFNTLTLPTYFSDRAYGAGLRPSYEAIFNQTVNGTSGVSGSAIDAARAAFNPNVLDRDFDLSNFQVGIKAGITLAKFLTLTFDGNYSRPLGNLQSYPYNQSDNIWGGANLNCTF